MKYNRRAFIRRGVTYVGAGLVAPRLLMGPSRGAARAGTRGARLTVIVELNGGNDGLNTIVPYTESRYYSVRPRLALAESELLLINDELGMHPNLGGLKSLYDAGRLAILQGVGYPNSDRSHFRSTEIWQTAIPDSVATTGWFGRYLDLVANPSDLDAVALGYETPATLFSDASSVASIGSVDAYELQADGYHPEDEQNKRDAFAGMYEDARNAGQTLGFVGNVGAVAYSSSQVIKQSVENYEPAVPYAEDPFSQDLLLVAQIIGAGLGTTVYYTSLGSFDTHANQVSDHATLLRWLSDGLSAFHQDMSAHGLGDDLLIMTFSEFGRRVEENSSLGTDHGAAAPLFVLGNAVRGGLYGDHPSLTDLDEGGDLKHGIDFRAVYATVLDNWLGVDSQAVLGGNFEDLGFLG
jgi:uncharacterized protein (DUF1501 family)